MAFVIPTYPDYTVYGQSWEAVATVVKYDLVLSTGKKFI